MHNFIMLNLVIERNNTINIQIFRETPSIKSLKPNLNMIKMPRTRIYNFKYRL